MKTFKLIFLLFLFSKCNSLCEKGVDIVIVSIEEGDKVEVQIDDGKKIYRTISKKDESDEYLNTKPVISNYCNEMDSAKVSVKINNLDTTFYVNPSNVKRLYIGENMSKQLFVYHTFWNGSSDFVID